MLLLDVAIVITMVKVIRSDPASDQLDNYKKRTKGCVEILTTSNGAQVEKGDITALDTPELMQNEFFMDGLCHRSRQNIPGRIVHTKGNGAYGYFKVTNNISDICRASLFACDGKKTPVFVRFSLAGNDNGDSDTRLDARGFAIKFYTDEGNLDIINFNTEAFIYKDPAIFAQFSRASKRNPVTNFRDWTMFWDYVSLTPEIVPFTLIEHEDHGIPDGYRYLLGFSCHTYQVYNIHGISYFIRWHFIPDGGVKNIYLEKAKQIGCKDPDYAGRDLYNSIANGYYPSWTLKMQVLTSEDVKNSKIDPFDITKTLCHKKYKLRKVGHLVLNRNPKNHYAEVEQVAFCPGNVVRGILGAPDKAFTARRFAYKDAQRYRLGANFHNIIVNQPRTKYVTYDRDGAPPVGHNGYDAPNYYMNSFDGKVPCVDEKKPKFIKIKQYPDPYNFEQATERYNKLTIEQRQRLITNIVDTLSQANLKVQDRVVEIFKCVDLDLGFRTMIALSKTRK